MGSGDGVFLLGSDGPLTTLAGVDQKAASFAWPPVFLVSALEDLLLPPLSAAGADLVRSTVFFFDLGSSSSSPVKSTVIGRLDGPAAAAAEVAGEITVDGAEAGVSTVVAERDGSEGASNELNAARAIPSGRSEPLVVLGPEVACDTPCVDCDSSLSLSSDGAGEGLGADEAGALAQRLLRVLCLALNSSRNLVAKRGGSGAVRGTSVGYTGAVLGGRTAGLSRSRMKTVPFSVSMLSWRSM